MTHWWTPALPQQSLSQGGGRTEEGDVKLTSKDLITFSVLTILFFIIIIRCTLLSQDIRTFIPATESTNRPSHRTSALSSDAIYTVGNLSHRAHSVALGVDCRERGATLGMGWNIPGNYEASARQSADCDQQSSFKPKSKGDANESTSTSALIPSLSLDDDNPQSTISEVAKDVINPALTPHSPSTSTNGDMGKSRTSGGRNGTIEIEVYDQYPDMSVMIIQLSKPDYVDVNGLVACVERAMKKPPGSCIAITLLGRGHFNTVYRMVFRDGSKYAVRIPNEYSADLSRILAKKSEVSTMMYIRECALYPEIPVPRIYAWDFTNNNSAHTSYTVMEVMEGTKLQDIRKLRDGWDTSGFDALEFEEQIALTKSLARFQASLSKPVPFKQIGSIQRSDNGEYTVGPLCNVDETSFGGPYSSLTDLWRSLIEKQVLHAVRNWSALVEDQRSFLDGTPQEFSYLLHLLSALIMQFIPPDCYLTLTLHHPDLAIRNVLVDPTDYTRIAAVLDWSGVQILPMILTAKFPGDFMSEGDDPCTRTDFNVDDAHWATVPFDWASIGDTSGWPPLYQAVGEPIDMTQRAVTMVRRYYLRQFYGSCFGQYMAELHKIRDLRTTTLFAVAPYYMKLHEVLLGGHRNWIIHSEWIKETYWRLALMPPKADAVIVGPNVYKGRIEAALQDLTMTSMEGESPRVMKQWHDDDEAG